jgi:hypothetical protein
VDTVSTVIISDVATLALSLISVLFVAGMRWGQLKHDIEDIKHDIAQIQGMFVIRIRRDSVDKED